MKGLDDDLDEYSSLTIEELETKLTQLEVRKQRLFKKSQMLLDTNRGDYENLTDLQEELEEVEDRIDTLRDIIEEGRGALPAAASRRVSRPARITLPKEKRNELGERIDELYRKIGSEEGMTQAYEIYAAMEKRKTDYFHDLIESDKLNALTSRAIEGKHRMWKKNRRMTE